LEGPEAVSLRAAVSEAREEERRSRTEAGVALSAKRCRSLRVCERDNSEWDARIWQ
jgi:hypothetical protein